MLSVAGTANRSPSGRNWMLALVVGSACAVIAIVVRRAPGGTVSVLPPTLTRPPLLPIRAVAQASFCSLQTATCCFLGSFPRAKLTAGADAARGAVGAELSA